MSYADPAKAPKGAPISESTGPVASDSLAAESVRSGGAFAENSSADVLGVKGSSSTLANSDTSNAETLPAASSAATRDDKGTSRDAGSTSDLNSAKFSGVTNQDGYVGGKSQKSRDASDDAPSYAADLRSEGELKPKGENLVEGKGIPKDRDTFVGDVDSKKDPSRLAQQELLKDATDFSGGLVRDNKEVEASSGAYEALKNDESA